MKEVSLKDYCDAPGNTQSKAAQIMGVTQGAVWQMLNKKRSIYFRISSSGEVISFFENLRPGKQSRVA